LDTHFRNIDIENFPTLQDKERIGKKLKLFEIERDGKTLFIGMPKKFF